MLDSWLKLWVGPLPKEEIFPSDHRNPVLLWLIHPIKRRLAKAYLFLLQTFTGLKVIAITGSAGKTTTKNLLKSILSESGSVKTTTDNTTSTFNIPTAILKTPPGTKYLILEMSIEYPGDMYFYTWLAKPHIAIFLNANRTHTTYLKDIATVAKEKSQIARNLTPKDFLVLNSDDSNIPDIKTNGKIYKFGHNMNSFCTITDSLLSKDLTTQIKLILNNSSPLTINLPLIGEHLAENTAAAVTTACLLGIPEDQIISGLLSTTPTPRRLYPYHLKNSSILIDDTHNANPLAASQSISTLAKLATLTKATPLLVFAQMNELGQYEKSSHEEIGLQIKQLGIKKALFLGPATKFTQTKAQTGEFFENHEELTAHLKKLLSTNTKHIVLIKGSRAWQLEKVVNQMVNS